MAVRPPRVTRPQEGNLPFTLVVAPTALRSKEHHHHHDEEQTLMEDGTATPPAAAREARRRKILGSGTDRLAFITGQTKSVPLTPPSPATDREPPAAAVVSEKKPLPQERFEGKVDLPPIHDVNLPKLHLIDEAARKSMVTGLELLPKRESSDMDVKTHASPEMLIPSEGSSFQRYDPNAPSRREAKNKIFTASRINQCVSSSENIRLLSTVVIALFVVFSYHVGLFSATFRPVYLVLITDVSLVLALLLANGKPPENDNEVKLNSGEYDLAELFSLGLLVHKVTRAVFADCCLCIVLVIIGIPFGDKLVS